MFEETQSDETQRPTPWYHSWPVVLAAVVVLPPLGLVLLLTRREPAVQGARLGARPRARRRLRLPPLRLAHSLRSRRGGALRRARTPPRHAAGAARPRRRTRRHRRPTHRRAPPQTPQHSPPPPGTQPPADPNAQAAATDPAAGQPGAAPAAAGAPRAGTTGRTSAAPRATAATTSSPSVQTGRADCNSSGNSLRAAATPRSLWPTASPTPSSSGAARR